jgi:heme exporter protein B
VIATALVVGRKDLLLEARGRRGSAGVAPFAATLLVLFGLAFGPGTEALRAAAPAAHWFAVLFAGALLIRGSLDVEVEDGGLDELRLAPADPAGVFLGKVGAIVVQLALLQVALWLGIGLLFGVAPTPTAALLLGWLAATVGFAAVGLVFGALTAHVRARESLLPILLLPLCVPVLLGGMQLTASGLAGRAAGDWASLLVAFAVITVAAGALVFDHVLEA